MLRVCARDDTACIILLHMMIFENVNHEATEFACSQVTRFMQESKSCPKMVYRHRSSRKLPIHPLHFYSKKESIFDSQTLSPYFLAPWYLHLSLTLSYSLGIKCLFDLRYKMMGWCRGLFLYIHRETICFVFH